MEAVLPSLIDGVILALVIEKPSYGYEIHQRFERRLGGFLSTSLASVYDALSRLEDDEYVEVAGRSGPRGRPRMNFRATAKGIEIHLSWLAERLREDPGRFELLSRLASTYLHRLDAKLKVIDCFLEESSQEARQIAMPECDDDLLWDLLIELRRRVVTAQLEWGAYARSKVLERAETQGAQG
jgi:DNA-binding PadR family transcriptional regulator